MISFRHCRNCAYSCTHIYILKHIRSYIHIDALTSNTCIHAVGLLSGDVGCQGEVPRGSQSPGAEGSQARSADPTQTNHLGPQLHTAGKSRKIRNQVCMYVRARVCVYTCTIAGSCSNQCGICSSEKRNRENQTKRINSLIFNTCI